MSEGRILAATQDGSYVLRLLGDVRMTLCTTLDEFIAQMLDDPRFASVWIDLCDTEGVDSTTLGQLAQLALRVDARYGFKPAIYCCDPGLNRLLHSMGFERLFDMYEQVCCNTALAEDVPIVPGSEQSVRERVIEAHRVLMSLSEDNAHRFRDLMAVLESSPAAGRGA